MGCTRRAEYYFRDLPLRNSGKYTERAMSLFTYRWADGGQSAVKKRRERREEERRWYRRGRIIFQKEIESYFGIPCKNGYMYIVANIGWSHILGDDKIFQSSFLTDDD